jgi:hypothetical protein
MRLSGETIVNGESSLYFFLACLIPQTNFFIKSLFLYTVTNHKYQTDFPPVPEWNRCVMVHLKSDFDSPWKEIMDRYFKDFTAFFFPVHSGKLNRQGDMRFWIKNYSG